MSHWNTFQEDKEFVLSHFREGFFDYVEVASQVAETQFFRWFLEQGGLRTLAEEYPTPRKKEEVPLWVYLSAQLTLRLHGSHGFSSLPYIVHCGGLKDALGPDQVHWLAEDSSGRARLAFDGYNDKNVYPRTTPCHHDFARKLARETGAEKLEHWFGTSLQRFYQGIQAYDPDGIFVVDGSYLFVPDNVHYENSTVLLFDEHNHPVDEKEAKQMDPKRRARCEYHRCYRAVFLLHTTARCDFYLYSGVHVFAGNKSETLFLRPLIQTFLDAVRPNPMKTLIFDRGFIDGPTIGWVKKECGVDCVFPLKKGMQDWEDAKRLAKVDKEPWQVWRPPSHEPPPPPPDRPEWVTRREQKRMEKVRSLRKGPQPVRVIEVRLKVIRGMDLWDTCPVPVDVVLLEEHRSDGEVSDWALATTRPDQEAETVWKCYQLRAPSIEERNRQVKCFWDLTGFRSCKFELVVNQVVFVLMAYSLMQAFLLNVDRGDLSNTTRQRLLDQLLPTGEKVVLYYENRVAYLRILEYQELLLSLAEGARRRILGKTRRLRRGELEVPPPSAE
jgi:hypothetical protein